MHGTLEVADRREGPETRGRWLDHHGVSDPFLIFWCPAVRIGERSTQNGTSWSQPWGNSLFP